MLSRSQKIVLFLLAFIQFIHIVDFMIIMPLGMRLMQTFQISPDKFGMLVSSYTFAAGLMSVISAFFMDRFDRKKCLQVFFVGFALGTLACAFSRSYTELLLARIFTGMFGGVLSSLVFAIVSDFIPVEHRGKAMGIVSTAFAMASIFGVPLGITLATKYDWHAPFLCLGIVSVAFIFMIFQFVPTMNQHIGLSQSSAPRRVMELFVESSPRLAMIFLTLIMVGQFTIVPFLTAYLISNTKTLESDLPVFYFCGGIASIIVAPWAGRISDKMGRQKVATLALMASIPAILLLTNLKYVNFWVCLSIFTLFFMAASARMVTTMSVISTAVTMERRGTFMSLISSIQQFSAAIGSLIAGVIVVKGVDGALHNYYMVGLLASALTLGSIFLLRGIKQVEGLPLQG